MVSSPHSIFFTNLQAMQDLHLYIDIHVIYTHNFKNHFTKQKYKYVCGKMHEKA